MNYVLIGSATVVGLLVMFQLLRKADLRKLARYARYVVGGVVALLTAFLLLRGQVGIASVTGYLAFMILKFGRIGPWSFEGTTLSEDNESAVKSRFISMTLDHDTAEVEGRVVAGAFKGAGLMDLGPDETRQLLAEVSVDADSLALLETWLDKNREGWREYFADADSGRGGHTHGAADQGTVDADAEALEVLGLSPGATDEEVREAHHRLMKSVHPDQGGSNYLASKINAAKDRLLRKPRR